MALGTLAERRAAKKAIEASGQKFTADNYSAYQKSQAATPATTAESKATPELTFGSTLTEQVNTSNTADFGTKLAQNTATQSNPATAQAQMDTTKIGTPDAPKSGGAINFDDKKDATFTTSDGDVVTNWSLSAPDKYALEAYSSLLSTTNANVTGYTKKLDDSIKTYERSFNELSQIVADQGTQFHDAMIAMAEQGTEVDFNNEQLLADVKEAMASGEAVDFEAILSKYPVENTVSKVGGVDIGTPDDPQSGGRLKFQDMPTPDGAAPGSQTKDQIINDLISATGKDNLTSEEWKAIQAQADEKFAAQSGPTDIQTPSTGVLDVNTTPEVEVPTSELVGQTLDGIKGMSQQSLTSVLEGAGYNVGDLNSAEQVQIMVAQQGLDLSNDPGTAIFLEGQKMLIDKTYADAIAAYNEDIDGISRIIDGEDLVPSSYNQLAAKISKQNADFAKENIDNEIKYQNEQYNITMGVEREKRGRLEGYLKAKLVAGGMADSSAGLASMAVQVNAADARIAMAKNEHMRAISSLNIQSRQVMTDYTNNIIKIGLDADTKKSEAMQAHAEGLATINQDILNNTTEKNALKMAAISQFGETMNDIEKTRKEDARYEEETQYAKMKDAVDQAYKLSGLTGTVYATGANGEMIDTGIKTFDNKQWESSNALSYMKYSRDIANDSYNKAIDMIDRGVDAASVESMLDMTPGSLGGMTSKDDMKAAVGQIKTDREVDFFINGDKYASVGSAIGSAFVQDSKGGQCGTFMHSIYNIPSMGNSLQSKIRTMTQPGVGPAAGNIVVFDEGTKYGHIAAINAVDMENRRFRLTESNYPSGERVRNDRWISFDNPKIRGFGRQELKPEFKQLVRTAQDSKLDKFVERAATTSIADARRDLKEATTGYSLDAKREIYERFEDRINEKQNYNFNLRNELGSIEAASHNFLSVKTGDDTSYSPLDRVNLYSPFASLNYTGKSIYELEQEKKAASKGSFSLGDTTAELEALANGDTTSTGDGEFDQPIG